MNETYSLGHGFGVVVTFSKEDRPEVVKLKTKPARRWGYNGHLWETCKCGVCRSRRAGNPPKGSMQNVTGRKE